MIEGLLGLGAFAAALLQVPLAPSLDPGPAPECPNDSSPPCVLQGSFPPSPSSPASAAAPASPRSKNPIDSSSTSSVIVNES